MKQALHPVIEPTADEFGAVAGRVLTFLLNHPSEDSGTAEYVRSAMVISEAEWQGEQFAIRQGFHAWNPRYTLTRFEQYERLLVGAGMANERGGLPVSGHALVTTAIAETSCLLEHIVPRVLHCITSASPGDWQSSSDTVRRMAEEVLSTLPQPLPSSAPEIRERERLGLAAGAVAALAVGAGLDAVAIDTTPFATVGDYLHRVLPDDVLPWPGIDDAALHRAYIREVERRWDIVEEARRLGSRIGPPEGQRRPSSASTGRSASRAREVVTRYGGTIRLIAERLPDQGLVPAEWVEQFIR